MPRVTTLTVARTERLTPHMVRVVATGPELASFPETGFTDRYVKILFPLPGVQYPEPFDLDVVRERFPREQQPRVRTYTVRAFDPARAELTIDFVHHGDAGLAGPWAAAAQPGDTLRLLGPGGAYAPDPAADWHLLVGDEAAIPAIAAALERIPAGVPVHAIVQVAGEADEQPLDTPGDLRLQWLHRDGNSAGQLLGAVAALAFPEGRVHAFVHGEAGEVKELRRHLLTERGVPRDDLSVSGYWRRGRDEEGFRVYKREEAEQEKIAAGR
ncbi:siderophore-interacting protein [Pseudonocardia sp. WMMC193]|uniref:siderophore-interacting protein n=1 Tax=Pseudonocardia sp. WMMC193 TaxID=2911965 RepID=UPI001F45578F|nr:siderophore-interacting protein [Pseudonocardia sp. WMMC193]MCF7552523.1 siderophore-interacting protein [Pseudonocardia sp. WMMC193]